MNKKLFLLLLILVGINLNQSKAQNTMMPHIQLKGESKIKILPDLGILYIQINATAKTEAECNDRLNKLNDELMKNLKKEGFTPEQIKLTNYSISAEWDYSDGKSKKIGYRSYQDFRIEFKLDKKRILSVYNKLSESKSENVSISFGTDCSDELKKKTKNELIVLAIKDATQKAQLMAETTGNKLGNMEFIRYGIVSNQPNYPMHMESKVAFAPMADSNEERAENFSINEIEFTEEIEMSFMIVK